MRTARGAPQRLERRRLSRSSSRSVVQVPPCRAQQLPASDEPLLRALRVLRAGAGRSLVVVAIAFAIGGCGSATPLPPVAAPAMGGARPAPPTPDAVWVQFEPEVSGQRWSLLANDSKPLCDLPCAHWVSATSGEFLQYDVPGTNRALQVSLPEELGAPGSTAIATARLANAYRSAGTKMMFGGLLVAFLGGISFAFLDGRWNGVGDSIGLSILGASVPIAGLGNLHARGQPPQRRDFARRLRLGPHHLRPRPRLPRGRLGRPPRGPISVVTPLGTAGHVLSARVRSASSVPA